MTNAVDLPAVEGTELYPLLREELAMHLCHVFPQLPIWQTFSVLVLTEETHVVQCGHGLDPEGLLEKWEKEETERYFMESAPEIVLSDDDSDQE